LLAAVFLGNHDLTLEWAAQNQHAP